MALIGLAMCTRPQANPGVVASHSYVASMLRYIQISWNYVSSTKNL